MSDDTTPTFLFQRIMHNISKPLENKHTELSQSAKILEHNIINIDIYF